MKHIKLFEEFLNESKIEKMSSAWYYEEIKIPGFTTTYNTIKANKDATKAASALVAFWEKGKSFDSSGLYMSSENLTKLNDLSKKKVGDVVEVKMVDSKTDKDYLCKIEFRDNKPLHDEKVDLWVYVYCSRV
jgi:uncharacterized OB-fold protein